MKRPNLPRISPAWLVAALLAFPSPGPGAPDEKTNPPIPLIVMEGVPLTEAIVNLARQAEMNVIIDPAIAAPPSDANGKFVRQPDLSVRWTNLTAEQAIDKIVSDQELKKIENPATSVTRIVPAAQSPAPVPSSQLGKDTNSPLPLIEMKYSSLDKAIRKLAEQDRLDIVLDPSLEDPDLAPNGRVLSRCYVSFVWHNLTPRQALAALLDNYDLVLIEGAPGSPARITVKEPIKSAPGPAGEPPGKK